MIGICSSCKEPCEVIVVDFGIGHYEYWGFPGYDQQIEVVSNCCEAPVYWKGTKTFITIQDIKDEKYDRFYWSRRNKKSLE